ncbi:acetamidase/formamidase family protein [Verrucomicrobiota bacterium]
MTDETVEIRQKGPYHYTYAETHGPVARVKPGQRVRIHCVDCFADKAVDESQPFEEICRFPRTNPQTGPVYVEGAEPADTLRVHIEDIEITRDWAVTGLVPGFGLLTGTATTAMLTPELPEVHRRLPIHDGRVWFGRFSRPLQPFMGSLGTAPSLEAVNSLTPSCTGPPTFGSVHSRV